MPSRSPKFAAVPQKVNFAEAYNVDRYENGKDGAPEPATKIADVLARFQLSAEALPVKNKYAIVSSDLDDDRAHFQDRIGIPSIPRTWHGFAHERNVQPFNETDADVPAASFFSFVDTMWFHTFSGLVICVNAVIIGLETDIETPVWWWMDQFMLAFFFVELLAKLCRHGLSFWTSEEDWFWNLFDFLIVLSGVFDQWFVPVYQVLKSRMSSQVRGRSHMTVVFMLLRMARLLRIVRLFRLIKIIRPLFELAQGILVSLQGMFWVLVFMMMTLYAIAMLCVLFLGDGELYTKDMTDKETKPFRKMFRSVSSSLYALFGTMSSWSLTELQPLFEEVPGFKIFFVIFYIYSSWALLAVMTGVVSENMLAIREQMMKEDMKKEEMRKDYVLHFLGELFKQADSDRSGQISKDEFDVMCKNPDLAKKLMKYSKMEVNDLKELFEWVDHDHSGTIDLQEFMEGFKWINEQLRAKSLVKVYQRLGLDLKSIRTNVVATVETRFEEVNNLLGEPLRKVHAICEQMQSLDATFCGFGQEVKNPLEVPTHQELRDAENRLSTKLARVYKRLEQVEAAALNQRSSHVRPV